MYGRCRKLILKSIPDLAKTTDNYMRAHVFACRSPRPNEAGIWALINAFATLADNYAARTDGEILLGSDYYYHDQTLNLINAMRAYLNFDVGRFDCGTLDRLICDLAEAAGVEIEP